MEIDQQNQDIINLLTKLKGAGGEYPEHMRVARRQGFLQQMAEIGLGIGAAAQIKSAPRNGAHPKTPPFTTTLLETALIAVIIVETSAMAYVYRDKLADFFQSNPTPSGEVAPPTALPTSLEVQGVSPSPSVIVTSISVTATTDPEAGSGGITITPTGTSIPGSTQEANQLNATSVPNGNNNNGNNGNHYGQTPKPERTKENNGNNGNNGSNKDPKPTKDK